MIKHITLILLILLFTDLYSQNDSLDPEYKTINKYGIAIIPSSANNIYGIALGLIGSDAVCNIYYPMYSHGINLQILGQGIFQILYTKHLDYNDLYSVDTLKVGAQDSINRNAIHNGVILSLLGTCTNKINGISVSSWMSMGKSVNGISINLLWNYYERINGISVGFVNSSGITNGLQIGIVNKTIKLNGFQIGFWNINEKRTLPLLNWCFKQ